MGGYIETQTQRLFNKKSRIFYQNFLFGNIFYIRNMSVSQKVNYNSTYYDGMPQHMFKYSKYYTNTQRQNKKQ